MLIKLPASNWEDVNCLAKLVIRNHRSVTGAPFSIIDDEYQRPDMSWKR
jgi:hypothetical protein